MSSIVSASASRKIAGCFTDPRKQTVAKGGAAQQGHGADCLQPTLRCGFRQRLMPGVRHRKMRNRDMDTPKNLITLGQAESERLTQYLSTLPPAAWTLPSACERWAVRN